MWKLNFKIKNHRKNGTWCNFGENLAGHRFLEGHRFGLDYSMQNLLIPRTQIFFEIFRRMRSHEFYEDHVSYKTEDYMKISCKDLREILFFEKLNS